MLSIMKHILLPIVFALIGAACGTSLQQAATSIETGVVQVAKDVCSEESSQPSDPTLVAVACVVSDLASAAASDAGAPLMAQSEPPKRAHVILSRATWEAMR
jgi:hypothetical protein